MELSRRKFLIGAAALVAAPAIVRASSIMRIKPERLPMLLHGTTKALTVTYVYHSESMMWSQTVPPERLTDSEPRMIAVGDKVIITMPRPIIMPSIKELESMVWAAT